MPFLGVRIGMPGTYLGSAGIPPLAQFIAGLKSDGTYSVFDEAWIGQATAAATLKGIVNGRVATVSGSPTFTPFSGYTGDGSAAFLDTTYNPTTNAVNLSQNSNAFGIFSLTNVTGPAGAWDLGQQTLSIAAVGTTSTSYFSRNGSSTSDQIAFQQPTSPVPGLYTSMRNASTGFSIFYNGAQVFTESASSISPNIFTSGSEQQGWTTDGSFNYTSQTGGAPALIQRNISTWVAVQTNSNPFAGLAGSGLNHIGDIAYASSNIYAPISKWSGSCGGANGSTNIAVFRTSDLTLIQSSSAVIPSATGSVIAGIAADTDHNILYGVDFCDPTVIYRFNLTTLAQLPSLTISIRPFASFQGIAYLNNLLYLSADDGTATQIPILDLNGNLQGVLHNAGVSGYEGIGITGSTVGVMGDNDTNTAEVSFFAIPTLGTTQSIVRMSSALSNATMTVFKINGGTTFTANQIPFWFVGGALTQAQIASLNSRLRTYLHAMGSI